RRAVQPVGALGGFQPGGHFLRRLSVVIGDLGRPHGAVAARDCCVHGHEKPPWSLPFCWPLTRTLTLVPLMETASGQQEGGEGERGPAGAGRGCEEASDAGVRPASVNSSGLLPCLTNQLIG